MAEILTKDNIQQGSYGFDLLLPFTFFRIDSASPVWDDDDTWKVKIKKPSGTSLIKTTEDTNPIYFPDTNNSALAVPIIPFDLDEFGTYTYEVIKTTDGILINANVDSFTPKESMLEGMIPEVVDSPLANKLAKFNAFGNLDSTGIEEAEIAELDSPDFTGFPTLNGIMLPQIFHADGIDAVAGVTTDLGTVGTSGFGGGGYIYLPTSIVVKATTGKGSTYPTISIGFNEPDYNDIVASISFSGIPNPAIKQVTLENLVYLAFGSIIKVKFITPATGTCHLDFWITSLPYPPD